MLKVKSARQGMVVDAVMDYCKDGIRPVLRCWQVLSSVVLLALHW